MSLVAELEETMKRLQTYKGIVGFLVINSEGIPIKTTMENTVSVQYAGLVNSLVERARTVIKDLDSTNDLTFIRLRSKKHEIMIAPDKEFVLIVVQNPTD